MFRCIVVISVVVLAGSSAWAQQKVDFSHDVLPILKARCASCHSNGSYKGGVSLDTREELLKSKAVVPGKGSASELIKRHDIPITNQTNFARCIVHK